MSNNKQTSVDWLIHKLTSGEIFSMDKVIEKARAMHREEVSQAYSDGLGNGMHHERGDGSGADLDEYKYYEQTFETK